MLILFATKFEDTPSKLLARNVSELEIEYSLDGRNRISIHKKTSSPKKANRNFMIANVITDG